jgi:regulatory protein
MTARDSPRRRDSALLRAVALLARREHSSSELRAKLLAKGFPQAEVDAALERLAAQGLQSDQRFAEALVRSRVQAGQGPARLRMELARHGVADWGEAALAAQASEEGWLQRALDFARRRFPEGARDARDERRLGDQLLRRGHSPAHVREVIKALRSEVGPAGGECSHYEEC